MPKRFYKATTKGGVIATRSTASMNYSHAVIRGTGDGAADGRNGTNWCGRRDLAHKIAGTNPNGGEVCEAVEITGKEYRTINKKA
jgi:hypothetical protein